jgi:hypothetical protein
LAGEFALTSTMRLRYAGRCRECQTELPAGTAAVYDRETKTVICVDCTDLSLVEEEPFEGTAGASAQREHDRRKNNRETRTRDAHPHLGGLILALTDDPQSTKAWAVGARGEELLGARLSGLASETVRVLHDRRIRGTKANIDHIVVAPSGVFVIDAKRYKDRPTLRVEGGIIRPRVEKLFIGSRDKTMLVAGVSGQMDRVKSALEGADVDEIPVHGMLCFVEADWPLIGGTFSVAGIHVLWPRKAAELIQRTGSYNAETVQRIHRTLALSFPSA